MLLNLHSADFLFGLGGFSLVTNTNYFQSMYFYVFLGRHRPLVLQVRVLFTHSRAFFFGLQLPF